MYKIEVSYSCNDKGNVIAKIRVVEADEGFNKFIIDADRGFFSLLEKRIEGKDGEAARAAVQEVINKVRLEVERRRESQRFCMSQVETYTI